MIPPNNINRMIIYLLEYKKGICIENRLERSVPVIKTLTVSLGIIAGCLPFLPACAVRGYY